MKKFLLFLPILFLIFATTITKNSTKKLDENIYETKENLRVLEGKYEFFLLDFNYLSSPKKLYELSKIFFEEDLVQKKKENFIWVEINNGELKILKKNIYNEQ